jgi:hypothetical protein
MFPIKQPAGRGNALQKEFSMSMKQAGKDLFAEFQKTNWSPFIAYRVKIRLHDIVGGIAIQGLHFFSSI